MISKLNLPNSKEFTHIFQKQMNKLFITQINLRINLKKNRK